MFKIISKSDQGFRRYGVDRNVWYFLRRFSKKLSIDGRTDERTFLGQELMGSNCSLFNATPLVDFLTPLNPNPNPIPTRWTECNPIQTKCTLTLTPQCQPPRDGHPDDGRWPITITHPEHIKGHQMMRHAKYEYSCHYGLSQEDL